MSSTAAAEACRGDEGTMSSAAAAVSCRSDWSASTVATAAERLQSHRQGRSRGAANVLAPSAGALSSTVDADADPGTSVATTRERAQAK